MPHIINMSPLQILPLLLSLFIIISYGQTNNSTMKPTQYPTQNPIPYCDKTLCKTYVSPNNTEWLLSSGNGCKDEVNGLRICVGCPDINFKCQCVSENTDLDCQFDEIISNAAEALATWLIVVIVIASVCGLCIIGSIIYCVCAGALCCASMSK